MKNYQNFYFVGIGGIGMSALARYFHAAGKNVLGYDKTETQTHYRASRGRNFYHFEDVVDEKISSLKKEETLSDLYTCD
jgi:UDP-N-acetylmuramate--alanine ligase